MRLKGRPEAMVSSTDLIETSEESNIYRAMLTDDEKSAYIAADLCLMAAPSQLGAEGAESRWDDLQWNHIRQSNFIHVSVCNLFPYLKFQYV
jgi:hypothetical protein